MRWFCRTGRTNVIVALSAIIVALMVVMVGSSAPANGQVGATPPTCSFAHSVDGGFDVRWSALGRPVQFTIVERAVRSEGPTGEGEAVWWWRGRVDEPGRRSFLDDPAPPARTVVGYRVRLVTNMETTTVDCTTDFACRVDLVDGRFRVEWSEPTSSLDDLDRSEDVTLDDEAAHDRWYVIERDVGRDGFHWRGRSVAGDFVDDAAPHALALPTYRVKLRVADNQFAHTAECGLDLADVGLPRSTSLGVFTCPVPGSSFENTWGAPRDGGARQHRGVDMFAPEGSPVLAPEAGRIEFGIGGIGGKYFRLSGESGAYYYGAHLASFLGQDRRIEAGEPIGTVGRTGNAQNTPPHLHFQIHPGGRNAPPVDPTHATRQACT